MKSRIFTVCFLSAMALSGTAMAQGLGFDQPSVGKEAGGVMVRARVIGVLPQNWASTTSIGGTVSATDAVMPELDASYFFTDNVAIEGIASSTHHRVQLQHTAIGNVDAGDAWVLPPTITLQYHFMPKEKFSPYIGGGINLTWFYASQPSLPTVTKFTLSNNVGGVLQAGFDYALGGHWFANFDLKQIFLQTTAQADTKLGHVSARTSLSPTVIGAGIGYRF